MAVLEGVVLDGLDLNPAAGAWTLEQLDIPLPAKRLEWAQGADADGADLVRDPLFDNREITARLRVKKQGQMDAALGYIAALVDKFEETERQPDGLPLVWTPSQATKQCTFQVLTATIAELPMQSSGADAGWLLKAPVLTAKMICKPFGYLPALTNITDDFSSDTIANYTADAGSGTISVTGGQLVPSSTAEKRLVHTASVWPLSNTWVTFKVTTGASVASGTAGAIGKRLDAANYIVAQVEFAGAASVLRVQKVDGGTPTSLAVTGSFTTATATSYWVRCRFEGNTVIAEYFTAAPTAISTPTQTVTATLAGGDATKFGKGVQGRAGIRLTPQATDWRADDLGIEPNSARSTLPHVELELANVPGDVPAEGRLTISDGASKDRRDLEWGIEQRYYTPASPPSLILDSDGLTLTGFDGVQTARTGGYDPNASNPNVIRATVAGANVIICGTPVPQLHVGSYRVKARVATMDPRIRIRFIWGTPGGPFTANPWATGWTDPRVYTELFLNGTIFSEVDLGVITIPPAVTGAQGWEGRVELGGDRDLTPNPITIDVDYLELIPVEGGYGRARGPAVFDTINTFTARDSFDQSAGALAGKTLSVGGTWSGTGDTDDFAVETTGHTAQRTAVSDVAVSTGRFGIAGSTAFTDTVAQVDFKTTVAPDAGNGPMQGLVVRHTDSTHSCFIAFGWSGQTLNVFVNDGTGWVALTTLISGTLPPLSIQAGTWYTLRALVLANGMVYIWAFVRGTIPAAPTFITYHPLLDVGGVLASGKVGIYDSYIGAVAATRSYDNFFAAVPNPKLVIASAKSALVRIDGASKLDLSGTYYGPPPSYRGAGFKVPPAGDRNRTSRVVVKAARNDLDLEPASPLADALQVQALYTPRVLAVPR